MFRKFFSFLSRIFFGKRKKGPPTLADSTSKEPKKITEGQTQQIEKSKDTEIITTKTIVISGDRIQPAEELPKNEKKDEDEPEKEIKHTVIVETRKTEIFETEEETDDGAETEELKYENVDPDKNPPDYWSKEFQYLYKLIRYRIHKVFEKDVEMIEPLPELKKWRKHLRRFIINNHWENDYEEKVLLLIALAPYLYPDLFNRAIFDELKIHEQGKDKDERSELIERIERMGGIKSNNAPFFLPTGETAVFIMAGNSETKRFHVQNLFGAEHKFWQKKILWLEDLQNDAPPMHGRIIMSSDYVDLATTGSHKSPQFSITFPAKKISPLIKEQRDPPTLDDLVVPKSLKDQIKELESWLVYNRDLMNRFRNINLKKGYRTLFWGAPGCGKTFCAEILGYDLKKEVYKIDLSMVVSKYIGETEKNLEHLFSRAEDKGWILFFDEADALFGKRTNIRDAHDKYANQEVSYLLQRIEDYNGLVILATNKKNNIDEAFLRRFNSVFFFPFPDPELRVEIWNRSFPKGTIFKDSPGAEDDPVSYDDECNPLQRGKREIDIGNEFKKYELSGGSIINVVHYAGIKAEERYHEKKKEARVHAGFEHEDPSDPDRGFIIYLSDIREGIRRELIKEGKPF